MSALPGATTIGAMAHVLVIEDDADLQEVLRYNLKAAGHEVVQAQLAQEGLRLARRRRPDLVLLDLMLPDGPGTDVCRELRATPETRAVPVLMLTARGDEIDRVVGFEVGADDYVTKPFSVRELVLRVAALLKRSSSGARTEPEGGRLELAELLIDLDAHRVWVAGAELELTPLEFRLLVLLATRRDRVQTREALLEEVWGLAADTNTRTIDTHVKRLREKLGVASRYLETVRGVGYRLSLDAGEP